MSLLVSRVLHAGYIFEHEKTKIIFDPIFENPFSRNCFAFPSVSFDTEAVKKNIFSAVFISHYHDDHCSLNSLDLIDRNTPLYLYCQIDELFALIRQMGFTQIYSLQVDSAVDINSITVIPRLALDAEVDTIFEIHAGQIKVLNVVDAWIDPSALKTLATQAPWDLVLWPFQTMLEIQVLSPNRIKKYVPEIPEEWIEQLQVLEPKNIVPSSCQFLQEDWSWYNQSMFPISYKRFTEEIQAALPHTGVIRLDPGSSLKIGKLKVEIAPSLNWIHRTDSEVVDYDYHPLSIFPKTSEIAKNFLALTDEQINFVFHFCKKELVQILNETGGPVDPYFNQTRNWRLSVYDHLGIATHFYYKIKDHQFELIENLDLSLGWTTQLPMTKLYHAVHEGETITSMYIRVNDDPFDEKTENELKVADLLSDPLIYALSYQSEITYQKAQLKKLMDRINSKNKVTSKQAGLK